MTSVAVIRAFRSWCLDQAHRQDIIGDFARDFAQDECSTLVRTLSGLDRHMIDVHGATGAALEARDAAWREYVCRRFAEVARTSPKRSAPMHP